MTLNEMLEYGPLVHFDEELGLYFTMNGSYLNTWVRHGVDNFENVDAHANGGFDPYRAPLDESIKRAEHQVAEISQEDDLQPINTPRRPAPRRRR
jgi:hypothetical protein